MTHSVRRIWQLFVIGLGITVLGSVWWAVVRQGQLAARIDNPRRVLAEQRIERGMIVDANGTVLARSEIDQDSGVAVREYPLGSATSGLGYYSSQFGVGGVEASFDPWLRGANYTSWFEERVLERTAIGGDLRLTIDADMQKVAVEALGGQPGAVIVVDAQSGHVKVMASTPGFDPSGLDDAWPMLVEDERAPLLNRAVQGRYQPGALMYMPIVLTAEPEVTPELLVDAGRVVIEGTSYSCSGDVDGAQISLAEAFVGGCVGGLIDLVEASDQSERALSVANLFGDVGVNGLDARSAPIERVDEADDLFWIGQGSLVVSPLDVASLTAQIANAGCTPTFSVLDAQRAPDGVWEPIESTSDEADCLRIGDSDVISSLMRFAGEVYLPDAGEVHMLVSSAIANDEGDQVVWFTGYQWMNGKPLVVTVLVENEDDIGRGVEIGGQLFEAAHP